MKLIRCSSGHLYNSDIHKKCPYCNGEGIKKEENIDSENLTNNENKTVAYWLKDVKISPVVGWLVCISGTEKGKDFRIINERNFIGRSPEMQICLENDINVARKNHASITYNPKQRIFMLTPGEANGIIYLQGKGLYESKQIFNYDIIEIGQNRFIFIALCNESFDWDI